MQQWVLTSGMLVLVLMCIDLLLVQVVLLESTDAGITYCACRNLLFISCCASESFIFLPLIHSFSCLNRISGVSGSSACCESVHKNQLLCIGNRSSACSFVNSHAQPNKPFCELFYYQRDSLTGGSSRCRLRNKLGLTFFIRCRARP
jgi:hypothetical protein